MKIITKLTMGIAMQALLCGSVLADTFYLQGTRDRSSNGGDTDYWENAKQWWWDAPTNGNNMTSVSGADFAGNRFELNGYSYNTWDGNSTSVSGKFRFSGTLVKGNETIHKWALPTWELAGLHVTAESVTAGNGIRFRDDNAAMSVDDFQLDGLLVIQANDKEHNFNLSVANLTGTGTLEFGDDDTLEEDGGSTWGLDIDNSDFAGTIRADVGNLEFTDAMVLPSATLFVDAGSSNVSVILSSDVTFGAARLGGTFLTEGTYTAAEVNAAFGGSRFSGSGALTVDPTAVPVQTFYLQAEKGITSGGGGNSDYWETYQGIWWDAPTGGSLMGTNNVAADFIGNRFDLNGFRYNSWNGDSAISDNRRRFYGTLAKDNAVIHNWTANWVVDGLHVTSSATSETDGMIMRRPNANLDVAAFKLDGVLVVRDNNEGYGLNLAVADLSGEGTLAYGRDNDETNNLWALDIDNAAFAGTIEVRKGILQFNDDITLSNATLSVLANDLNSVVLSNNASFSAMTFGATSVVDGTYSAGDLNALLGVSSFSGSGSLTVGSGVTPSGYDIWLSSYPALGSQTNLMDDAEADGMNNLVEYALGGNPTENDAAAVLPASEAAAGWLNLVYNRRVDAVDLGLTYKVVTDNNLVFGQMTNEVPEYGVSTVEVNGFVTATNRISTGTDEQAYMQLKIQLD